MPTTLLRLRIRLTRRLFETSEEDRQQAYHDVRDSHQMRASYLMMLVLACLVALFGLLSNSPAVVIGAMLISPLMSPFLSAGLALAIGDWALGRAALRTIFLSILAAVSISVLAVAASPLREATPEIMARTSPNLLDLGIAFFSGFAGTYTVVNRKGGTTIPGVAIATAVMPPLCVVGFGVFNLDWHIAGGALSLFVTNLAAIIISAACVFLLAAFRASDRPVENGRRWGAPLRIAVSFVVLGLLAVPLAVALVQAASVARLRQAVRSALTSAIERDPARARLNSGWTVRELSDARMLVKATAITVSYFDSGEVEEIERSVERSVGRPVELQLEQVHVQQGGLDPQPALGLGPAAEPSSQAPPSLEMTIAGYRPAAELIASVAGARLDRFFVLADEGGVRRLVVYAFRDDPPDAAVTEAAARALGTWKAQTAGAGAAPPGLELFVRPEAPVVLAVESPRGRSQPDLEPVRPLLERVGALLARDPGLRLKLDFEGEGIDPEVLRPRLLEAMGVPATRLVPTDDADVRAVTVRVAAGAAGSGTAPASGT